MMNRNDLTTSQLRAFGKMYDFVRDPKTKGKHFVLTGGPGTGKTFLTKYVIKGAPGDIGAAAISHAAKSILQEMTGGFISCSTLASVLGMTMNIDKDGAIVFKENSKGRKTIKRYDTLIIDEVSMIDDSLYDIIMNEARNANVRIIALGDRYQLPPVEQDHDSKFFDTINATLTESVRFSGPIGELSEIYRNQIQNINEGNAFDKWALNSVTNRVTKHDNALESGYDFTKDVFELVERAADDFKDSTDINKSRILAFKNKSVDLINTSVRHLLYGNNPEQFEEDELVISNSNYRPPGMAGAPLIHNGKVLRVHSFIEEDGPSGIPCIKLKFKDLHNYSERAIYVVRRGDGGEAMQMYMTKLNELKHVAYKTRGNLDKFREFTTQFAYFDYAYAVNLYRAQGSTLENAYVFEGEVMGVKPLTWKQKFQALYVAMTRPSKNLVIYNKDF